MFSSFSPSAEAHRLVIHHRLNLTIGPVEYTASSPGSRRFASLQAQPHHRFADCSAGVVHPTHQVCCNATCGLCGGHGCSSRPGGPRQCCMPAILRTGRVCESQADVACSLRGSSNPFDSIRARPRRTRGSRSPLTTSEQASLPPTAVEVPASLPGQTAPTVAIGFGGARVSNAEPGLSVGSIFSAEERTAASGLLSALRNIRAAADLPTLAYPKAQDAAHRVNATRAGFKCAWKFKCA